MRENGHSQGRLSGDDKKWGGEEGSNERDYLSLAYSWWAWWRMGRSGSTGGDHGRAGDANDGGGGRDDVAKRAEYGTVSDVRTADAQDGRRGNGRRRGRLIELNRFEEKEGDGVMRRLVLAGLVLKAMVVMAAAQGPAQPAVAGSNWRNVQALPVDTSIRVEAQSGKMECRVKTVDADSLTCVRNRGDVKVTVFQRGEVKSIRIPRKGRSTLIGAGIGGGTGDILGFEAGSSGSGGMFGPNAFRGAITAVFGALGGAIGAPTGYFTDFARSTVYRAP